MRDLKKAAQAATIKVTLGVTDLKKDAHAPPNIPNHWNDAKKMKDFCLKFVKVFKAKKSDKCQIDW